MHSLTLKNVTRRFRRETPVTPRLTKVLHLYQNLTVVDPATIKRNVRVFRLFIRSAGNVRCSDVTRLMATQFQAELKAAGKAKATVKSYCAAVSSVFGWAVENIDGVESNPFEGVKAPKLNKSEPVYFTRDEMERLFAAVEALDWQNPVQRLQWRAMLMVADTCGFRIGEILNLRWDDIDLDARRIVVRYRPHIPGECWEWGTKGHRDRAMPINNDDLVALLCRMKEVCPWRYPFLKARRCRYLQAHSGELTDWVRKRPYTNLYVIWKRIRTLAQVKGDGAFHQVRRTAATEFGEHLTAAQLQAAFGWQELSTAQRYLAIRNSAQMEAIARAQAARTSGPAHWPSVRSNAGEGI